MPNDAKFDPQTCRPDRRLMMDLANRQFECDEQGQNCHLKFDPSKDLSVVFKDVYLMDKQPDSCTYYFAYSNDVNSWKDRSSPDWYYAHMTITKDSHYKYGYEKCRNNRCPGDRKVQRNRTNGVVEWIGGAALSAGGLLSCNINDEGLGSYSGPDMLLIYPEADGSQWSDTPVVDADAATDHDLAGPEIIDADVNDVDQDALPDADSIPDIADIVDADMTAPEVGDIDVSTEVVKTDADGGAVEIEDGGDAEVEDAKDVADAEEVEVTPLPELCNGIDDDGDGQTDEAEDLDPPLASMQYGVCEGLKKLCLGDTGWYNPLPVDIEDMGLVEDYEPEELSCDNLDNDCNNQVDEGFGFIECGVGTCFNIVPKCVNGSLNTCTPKQPSDELCDGLDNDCDGNTDNDLVPPLATLQEGVCQGLGQICTGSGGWLDPDPDYIINGGTVFLFEYPEDSCDGLDNDCDGNTDQGLIVPLADNQNGVCENHYKTCEGDSGWQNNYESIPTYEAATETLCDGLDNNCDGQTDEGLPGATFMELCASVCPSYYLTQIIDYNPVPNEIYQGNSGPNNLYIGLDLFKSCENGNKTITLSTGSCGAPGVEIELEPDAMGCNIFEHIWIPTSGASCISDLCFNKIIVDPFNDVMKFYFCENNGVCNDSVVSNTQAYFYSASHACESPYDATCN